MTSWGPIVQLNSQSASPLIQYHRNGEQHFLNQIGILLPKLFWPTAKKNCPSDRGREFAKFLRSLEQFIQTGKGQNNFS
jgi:hypothetical protein